MEKSAGVQICLARREFSQDACGIPRFLWNNAGVLLIITPQDRLVLSLFMKKASPVTTSTLIEWIHFIFYRESKMAAV